MNDRKEWLAEMQTRLRGELDDLYTASEEHVGARTSAAEMQRRIARLLRAFHLIETGDYGSCAVCGERIERDLLAGDPATDTCGNCGPPIAVRWPD
ncbi:MAG: hypothetical protein AB1490_16675 [Pseudomonadota bacterium]